MGDFSDAIQIKIELEQSDDEPEGNNEEETIEEYDENIPNKKGKGKKK